MSVDPKNARNADIWIAGAFAAFTVDLLVYPLDTIKTRLQSPDYKRLYTNGADARVSRALFRGGYQGVGSVIVATLPSSGAFFTTYEGVKSLLTTHNPQIGSSHLLAQPVIHSAASATAELVSCAILTPAEVIKQNAQMVDNSSTHRPRVNATLQTLKRFQANPLALWRGYSALATRNLPATALQFPMFEWIRDRIRQYRDERGIRTKTLLEGGLITAASAGSAGSVAAVVTTPVDVVKTRIMLAAAESAAEDSQAAAARQQARGALVDATGKTVQGAQSVKDAAHNVKEAAHNVKETAQEAAQNAKENVVEAAKNVSKPVSRKGSMQIAREIMAEHGVKGLFRGGALRAVWTLVGAGLYLGTYESGRIFLAQRRGENIGDEDL